MTTINLINHTNAKVVVHQGAGETVLVEISDGDYAVSLYFEDGSHGIESIPNDGLAIQRIVDVPRGGLNKIANASDTDWSDCLAAIWANTFPRVRTCIHEVIVDNPKIVGISAPSVLQNLGAVARICGSVVQECDGTEFIAMGKLSNGEFPDE